jgi:tetratricopeptide (TPR) repeat protein
MRLFISVTMLLVIFISSIMAQNDADVIQYAFNAQWQKADSILDTRIESDPDNPKNYYLKQQVYYYARYFSGGEVTNDTLMTWIIHNATKTISLVENGELSKENKFYAGRSYDFLSRFQVRTSNWDAFWSARSARNFLEEVLEEDPEFYDAYMSLAVREYFTSRLTGFTSTLAWFTGMSGERDVALEQFHLVAEKGNLCKTEAQFALGAIYRFFENDNKQSLEITNQLLVDHPDNPFLLTQSEQVAFFELIDTNGAGFLINEFDSLRTKYQITNSGVLNLAGYSMLGLSRYEDALTVFKTNMKLFPGEANCYDSYAEGFWRSGDTQNAIKYYNIAYEKLDSDTTISDNFRVRLREGIENNLKELGAEISI